VIRSKAQRRASGERPTPKECGNKLREAKRLIGLGKWYPANPGKLAEEFEELEQSFGIDLTSPEDLKMVFSAALAEIGTDHYDGRYPPEPSKEIRTSGFEMFPFCWESKFFQGVTMYFKFSLGKNGVLWIYSFHPSRGEGNDD